ncbi:hypothetical protein PAXRUDRAFT_821190 [Paxillus rubicundulus Ve08.2h10]|uniref:Uncharacterized protein n=1 Tax=Paxillus rubicundulus Ve08.2h10 TaxID=930991 RepID=A0A0D0E6U7_9AGAM|nr:hypothetical protein PAXRUDRAFT_821190 [Paxillus rubicundulus Ve08.2h10]
MVPSKFPQGWLLSIATVFSVLSSVTAQNNTTEMGYPSDPVLKYRPPFAQSLPVQVFLTGIVLTLVAVLFLHLIFTAQYHWPLARTNYILQLTGVITLLISLIATLYIVFTTTVQQSQHWPYMLSYLAVDMPQVSNSTVINSTDPILVYQHVWTTAETATWVVMNATTSVIVQITHIHFLTLLYPSVLEARLIFCLLGPLAIISAVMQILPIISGTSVLSLSQDTRNVCNAALSMLFTSALLIWGFLVNRRQAWRTDGGTAAFGAGAILLALISTTLNIIYIHKQDQYTWMPELMWAVTLWQSFLGWWWWAGAGMGVREVEELLRREDKRQQKRKLRAQRRKEQKEKARSVWNGVAGAFRPTPRVDRGYDSSGSSRDRTQQVSRTRSRDATASLNPTSTVGSVSSAVYMQPFQAVQRWYGRLRHAHLAAAHTQAVERVERIHQVFGREEVRNSMREPGAQVVGWGLGSYGLREAERELREELEGRTSDRDVGGEEEWKSGSENGAPTSDQRLRHRVIDCTSGPPPPQPQPAQQEEEVGGSSLWWWGPLRRWRLKDSTTYR